MGEVYQHMGRPTCIAKSAYSRGEREEELELAAALGVRFWASGLFCAVRCGHKSQRGVNGQRGGARLDSLKHALKKDMSQVRMAFSVERARPAASTSSTRPRGGRTRGRPWASSPSAHSCRVPSRSFYVQSETVVGSINRVRFNFSLTTPLSPASMVRKRAVTYNK